MNKNLSTFTAILIARISPLIIGLVLLPIYKRYGTSFDFDAISTIFIIQSLSILLDAGIAQNAIRLSAVKGCAPEFNAMALVESINREILKISAIIGIFTFVYLILFSHSMNFSKSLAISASIYFIIKNNILQSSLIGAQKYIESAKIQVGTNLIRNIVLVFIFAKHNQSIELNVWINLLYLTIANLFIFKVKSITGKKNLQNISIKELKSHNISIASICGALAMQGDKLLVGALCKPGELGNYYLAQTIACIPLLFVSLPITQFFQPKLFRALSQNDISVQRSAVNNFALALFFLSIIPSLILVLNLDTFLNFWIGHGKHEQIIILSTVIATGTIPACFGYIFHSMLCNRTDFKYLANSSICLTTLVLLSTYFFTSYSLVFVCLGYALYHFISIVILIIRLRQKFKLDLALFNRNSKILLILTIAFSLMILVKKFHE